MAPRLTCHQANGWQRQLKINYLKTSQHVIKGVNELVKEQQKLLFERMSDNVNKLLGVLNPMLLLAYLFFPAGRTGQVWTCCSARVHPRDGLFSSRYHFFITTRFFSFFICRFLLFAHSIFEFRIKGHQGGFLLNLCIFCKKDST